MPISHTGNRRLVSLLQRYALMKDCGDGSNEVDTNAKEVSESGSFYGSQHYWEERYKHVLKRSQGDAGERLVDTVDSVESGDVIRSKEEWYFPYNTLRPFVLPLMQKYGEQFGPLKVSNIIPCLPCLALTSPLCSPLTLSVLT